jgi:hypothetical protein
LPDGKPFYRINLKWRAEVPTGSRVAGLLVQDMLFADQGIRNPGIGTHWNRRENNFLDKNGRDANLQASLVAQSAGPDLNNPPDAYVTTFKPHHPLRPSKGFWAHTKTAKFSWPNPKDQSLSCLIGAAWPRLFGGRLAVPGVRA